ncbi:MAG: lysophospholipid acyltransferase family protein [Burkholderiaceae bacterium]
MRRIHQIAVWIYGIYAWCIFALILFLFGGLATLLRRPPLGRRIVRFGVRLLFVFAGIRLSVTGLDRLPAQPHVLLVNHSSFLDGIVLTALLPASPGYSFVMRQEFDIQRLLCPLMKSLGALVLNRSQKKKRVRSDIDMMTNALLQGENLVIFPEGGFSPEPTLKPFHSGAFVAAANANVPIVVARLQGARSALKPKTWLPRRANMTLEIGPILSSSGKNRAAIMQFLAAARAAMMPVSKEADSCENSS